MKLRQVAWLANTKRELKGFPEAVKRDVGFALHRIQEGKKPDHVKPLKGLGSGVMEIVSNYDTNTYRAVYSVRFEDFVYVLHVFQKKSKSGIKTPRCELDSIKQRLRAPLEMHYFSQHCVAALSQMLIYD